MAYNPIVHKLTSSLDYKDQSIVFVNDDVSGDIDIQEVLSGSSSNVAINIKESTIEFTGSLDSNNSFENKDKIIFENEDKGVKFKGETDSLFSIDANDVINISAKDELCLNKDVKIDIIKTNKLTGSLIYLDNNLNRFLKSGKGYVPEIVDSPSGVKRWEIKAKPDMTFSFINLGDLLANNASGEYYLNNNTSNAINTTFRKSNGDLVTYNLTNINGTTELISGQTVTTPPAGAIHIRHVNMNASVSLTPPQSYLYPGGNTSDYKTYYTYDLSRLTQSLRENFLTSLVHTVVIIGNNFGRGLSSNVNIRPNGPEKFIRFMFRPWFPEIKQGMTFVVCRMFIPSDSADSNKALLNGHYGKGKLWRSDSWFPGFLVGDSMGAFRINIPLRDSSLGGGRYTHISDTGDESEEDHQWVNEQNVQGNHLDSEKVGGGQTNNVYANTDVIRYRGDGLWERIDDINH